jgi:hypothetical protein
LLGEELREEKARYRELQSDIRDKKYDFQANFDNYYNEVQMQEKQKIKYIEL